MKHYIIAALLLTGCAAPAPQTAQVVSSDSSNSKVSSVESGGTKRTEEYGRTSHADTDGSSASTHQKAEQSNPDGTVSSHNSDVHTNSDTLGFAEDEHHVVVSGSNVTHEFAVKGQDLAVSGNGSHLIFRGPAHGLSVTGNDNQVEVDGAEVIDVNGQRNQVTYTGTPKVTNGGKENTVVAK